MSQQELKVEQMKNWINVEGLDPNDVIVRKQFADVISIDPNEERTFIATISTTSCDSDNDIVWSKGCHIEKIMSNPVVLFSHQHSQPPIGKIVSLQINENNIVAKIKMATTTFANELWTLVQGGFLRSNSIGFIIKRQLIAGTREFSEFVAKNLGSIDSKVQRIISEFILVEDSLCSIPSNSEALVSAISTKSICVSDKLCKDMDLPKVEPVKESKACSDKECRGKECDNKECTCSCHSEETKETAKTEVAEVAEVPKTEAITEPKPEQDKIVAYTVIRDGGYKINESDKLNAKQIKQGKIIFI